MTRVEWNLSDGELLSCRRHARLEKIMVALGRRFLLAMWRAGTCVLPVLSTETTQ
jgi:hypothetical protein